jgi:hypothetical protein
MSGSTPVHTAIRYSYLSSDGIWLAKHDGLLNLCIIILVATNFRCGRVVFAEVGLGAGVLGGDGGEGGVDRQGDKQRKGSTSGAVSASSATT